jgi:hypothetical protein
VHISVASSLGVEAPLEVLDRVPVADDQLEAKALEVKLVSTTPKAEPYDQAERGRPVRGGLRFKLVVPPGGKAEAELKYKLVFSNKDEIVGGNRRE